jgi:hypothetical protein
MCQILQVRIGAVGKKQLPIKSVDSPPQGERIPALLASSMRPLDLAISARRESDYRGGEESCRTIEKI